MKRIRRIITCTILAAMCICMMPATTFASAKLNKTKITMYAGDTYKLKVKGSSKHVKWSSSNKSVATVSKSGKITAKKAGKVTVTAKIGSKKRKCEVIVHKKIMKYLNGNWHTWRSGVIYDCYKFGDNKATCYESNGKTVNIKYKVKYTKTNYGYYIKLTNKEYGSTWGYRLVLNGTDANKNELCCIGNGNPYSMEGYNGGSSLDKITN